MNIWFLILIAIILFSLMTFVRRWHDYAMLFTIAIGFAVNANIYNSTTTPIYLGELVFAIDSILYTGFTFTVIICAKDYSIRRALILTSSTVAAILLSAFIEFFANISSFGYDIAYFKKLLMYLFSALGTVVGMFIMLYVFLKLKDKNINTYVTFVICVLLSSIINSTIYYSFSLMIYDNSGITWYVLLGSYIGKIFSILLGLISYFINTHYWIPLNLIHKYKKEQN